LARLTPRCLFGTFLVDQKARVFFLFPEKAPKPDDIQAAVRKVYKGRGWTNIGDWLGKLKT